MSEKPDPYARIAEWYDIEHDGVSDDIECYLSLIAAPSSGRASILEIGSGTGRIAAGLAAAGHDVTGVEPSAAMRARAEARFHRLPERVRSRVRSREGSATSLGLAAVPTFDVALFGQGAYAHLTTTDDRYSALREAARTLKPGGQVLLDVDLLGPRRLLDSARLVWWQGSWPLPDAASELTHFVSGVPGPTPSTVDVLHIYDVHDIHDAHDVHDRGGIVARTTSKMTLAVLTYGEVVSEVLRAGLSIEATYGSYELSPHDHDSPRLIVDARR